MQEKKEKQNKGDLERAPLHNRHNQGGENLGIKILRQHICKLLGCRHPLHMHHLGFLILPETEVFDVKVFCALERAIVMREGYRTVIVAL